MAQEIKSWNNGIVEDQSGSTLPTVNADDNGKTLQVVNGQWDKGGKIPDPQLPAPAVGDIGKIVGAVSDGESGAEYGLVNAPSNVYILECSYADFQFSFSEGEAERLMSAIEAGKVIVLKLTGYDTSKLDSIFAVGSVGAGATSSFAMVYFEFITTSGIGDVDIYANSIFIMNASGTMSGGVTQFKLAIATQ